MPTRVFLTLACVATCFLSPRPAVADLDAEVTALDEATAKQLDDLAEACTKKRVFGCRDDAYAALLGLDPTHTKARKKLKYTRGKDGAWVQDPRYKRAKDWNRSAAKQARAQLRSTLAAHRAALLGLYEKAATLGDLLSAQRRVDAWIRLEPGRKAPPALLRTLSMRLYALVREHGLVPEMVAAAEVLRARYPEDIAVRSLLGETDVENRWVLVESARTLRGKSGVAAALETSRADVPLEAAPRSVREAKIALPWSEGVKAPDVRVVGTQKAEVLRTAAERAQAAGTLFAAVLGRAPKRRKAFSIVLFRTKGEIDTFLAGYPVVDNPTLRQRKKIGLDLVYADGRTIVLKANPPRAQTDLVVNETLNMMFADTFLESEAPKGWHAEGLSRYLAWKLTGSRLSIAVSGKYAGQGKDRNVPGSEDPWLRKARGPLRKGAGLDLLLGKGLDVFTARDSLIAYAFAVYLIEGHDHVVADFVDVLRKTADVDRACREVLGMPRTVVEHRLARWLDEVVPMPKPKRKAR